MRKVKICSIIIVLVLVFSSCTKNEEVLNKVQEVKNQDLVTLEGETTEEKVANLLDKMSLEEKAGQMLQGVWTHVSSKDMMNLGLAPYSVEAGLIRVTIQ